MRIGIDIKAFKNGTTGIARMLRSIMDELQLIDTRNEYVLFEPCPCGYRPENPRWRVRTVPWKLPGVLWQQFVLPFALRGESIDCLWAPEQSCPLYFMKNVRIITTFHDLVYIHFPHTCQLSTRLILRLLTPGVLRRSDLVHTVSHTIADDVARTYRHAGIREKIVPIANGRPDWHLPAGY